jgi:predicted enzyme related to lactoylglutathione lyase
VEGRLVHFEIRAADKRRAMGFWRSLFGWRQPGPGPPWL